MASSAAQETKISPVFSCENEDDDDELFLFAGQLATSVGFPMSLKAATELGVLEVLAKAPGQLSAEEIVAQLPGVHNPEAPAMLERILRLLATFSVLTCTVASTTDGGGAQRRLYSLARSAKYLVPNEDGASWVPVLSTVYDKVFLDAWNKVKDAVLGGGIPFNLAHGTSLYEYSSTNPRLNSMFNRAMSNGSIMVMKKLMQSYKGFENVKQLVDVGGGVGHTLQAIISKYPNIKGINFDLPNVIQRGISCPGVEHVGGVGHTLQAIVSKYPNIKGINFDLPNVIQRGISCPGVEHVGGDMFESVPGGDAIWLKLILHNWSDDHCIKLLKNCYKALPDDGIVIVVDPVIPEEPETTSLARFNALADVTMMSQVPGGKERTKSELESLAIAAGFTSIKLTCRVYGLWIMEFYK